MPDTEPTIDNSNEHLSTPYLDPTTTNYPTNSDLTFHDLSQQIARLNVGSTANRIPGVKLFSGAIEESYLDFIESYDFGATAEGWDDQKKAAQLWKYLTGAARTFYMEQPQRLDWNVIKELMSKHFVPPEVSRFHNDLLLHRRQKPGESIAEYAADISRLVKNSFPTLDNDARQILLRNHFLAGLRPDLSFHVTITKPAATYTEAYHLATNYESAQKYHQQRASGMQDNTSHIPQIFAGFAINGNTRGIRGNRARPLSIYRGRGRSQNHSFSSPRASHMQYHHHSTQRNPPTCYTCGRTGHISRDCRQNRHSQHHSYRNQSAPPPPQQNYLSRRGRRGTGRVGIAPGNDRGRNFRRNPPVNYVNFEFPQDSHDYGETLYRSDLDYHNYEFHENTEEICPGSYETETEDSYGREPLIATEMPGAVQVNHVSSDSNQPAEVSTKQTDNQKRRKIKFRPINMGTLFCLCLVIGLLVFGNVSVVVSEKAGPMEIYLCPTSAGAVTKHLPSPLASGAFPNISEIQCIRERTAQILTRSVSYGTVNATFCGCVTSHRHYLFDFLGKRKFIRHSSTPLAVSEMQCLRMMQWKDSPHGRLYWDGVEWSTNNSHPLAPNPTTTSCCHWLTKSVQNCHLYFAPLSQQEIPPRIVSPGANLPKECMYSEGKCQLTDGRFVIWKPATKFQLNCFYSLHAKPIQGFEIVHSSSGYTSSLWVSSDGTRAAKFDFEQTIKGQDCQKVERPNLSPLLDTLGDQYIQYVNTAASCINISTILGISLVNSMRNLYTQAYNQMATYLSKVSFALMTTPTVAIRILAQKSHVLALSSQTHIRMRNCFIIPTGQYRILHDFRWSNSYNATKKFLPIAFLVNNIEYQGFLTLEDNTVIPTLMSDSFTHADWQALWDTAQQPTQHYLRLFSDAPHSLVLDQYLGIPNFFMESWPMAPPPGFENIVTEEQFREIQNYLQDLFPLFQNAPLSWQHLWVFLVCIYVTLAAISLHCCPSFKWLPLCMPIRWFYGRIRNFCQQRYNSFQAWRERRVRRPCAFAVDFSTTRAPDVRLRYSRSQQSDSSSKPLLVPNPLYAPGVGVPAFVPVNVLQLNASDKNRISAIFPIKVRNRKFHALLDTGASISLIRTAVAQNLGAYSRQPSTVQATGITGHSFSIKGAAPFKIQIGRRKLYHQNLHLVDSCPYDILIGLDILQQLGSVTLNFENNQMHLYTKPPRTAADVIPMSNKPANWLRSDSPPMYRVFAGQSVTLPPRSHVIFSVRCDTTIDNDIDLNFSPSELFVEKYGLLPANSLGKLNKYGDIRVMVLNPKDTTHRIFTGTTIGHVSPLVSVTEMSVCTFTTKSCSSPQEQPVNPLEGLDLSRSKLSDTEKEELHKFLMTFSDVFASSSIDLGCFPGVEHEINTGNHPPIRRKPYRIPASQREEVEKQFQDMLEAGVIEPSCSPWASPLVIVPKRCGALRMCVDFRAINICTEKNVYPLPLIDTILDELAGAKYFTNLDLQSGYFQIKVRPQDRPKTAVITPMGLYQFVRLPFGLCNSPATFQNAMNTALLGLQPHVAMVYLDDVIIRSNTFEQHLKDLSLVLERFRQYNLKIKLKKCSFAQNSIKFLGHVVSSEGLKPDPAKIKAVKEMPPPDNVKGVRRFLGMAGYYRRFIKDFAKIAKPLFTLLRKDQKLSWDNACQQAFNTLKDRLSSTPVLCYPDHRKPYFLETDASGVGIGAVLSQKDGSSKLQPICYASRVLQPAERNYSVTELECLSVIWSLKLFRHYVLGNQCTVYTDHQALRWLLTQKSPSGRLARWSLALMEYNLTIQYRPGAANHAADALSRAPLVAEITINPDSTLDTLPTLEELRQAQRTDVILRSVIIFLQEGIFSETLSDLEITRIKREADFYELDERGILVVTTPHHRREGQISNRIVVPQRFQKSIMQQFHDSMFAAHPGFSRTLDHIQLRYFWNRMAKDIEAYVLSCKHCQKHKPRNYSMEPALINITPASPFELVGMDIMELPQTHSGNKYLLVIIDHFSSWIECFPLPDQRTETIAKVFIAGFVCRHGIPQKMLTDNGPNLISKAMREVYKLCGIKKIETTPYTPQSNGKTERVNRTIQQHLSPLVSKEQANWDEQLPFALFSIRTSKQLTVNETPYRILYGQDPLLPIDSALHFSRSPYVPVEEYEYSEQIQIRLTNAWQLAADNIKHAQAQQKYQHDKKISKVTLKSGDQVLIRKGERPGKSMKLGPRYSDPYKIIKVLGTTVVVIPVLDPGAAPVRVHQRRLKLFKSRQENNRDSEAIPEDREKQDEPEDKPKGRWGTSAVDPNLEDEMSDNDKSK